MCLVACKQNDFKLCGLGVTRPYYYTGLDYEGGLYSKQKDILARYIPVKSGENTGIVKMYFKVNCNAEVGDFYYEEYNLDYQKTDLNDSIETQLMDGLRQLSNWIPGKDEKGNTVNSHTFLTFRIMNGEVIEILPK